MGGINILLFNFNKLFFFFITPALIYSQTTDNDGSLFIKDYCTID